MLNGNCSDGLPSSLNQETQADNLYSDCCKSREEIYDQETRQFKVNSITTSFVSDIIESASDETELNIHSTISKEPVSKNIVSELFSNLCLVDIQSADEACSASYPSNTYIKNNANSECADTDSMPRFCSCRDKRRSEQIVDVCPYCQLLRSVVVYSENVPQKNEKYFDDEITQSQNLMKESESWFSETPDFLRKQILFSTDQPQTDFLDQNLIDIIPTLQTSSSNLLSTEISMPLYRKNSIENDLHVVDIEDETFPTDNVESLHFDSLPEEIKIRIFSCFTQRELCRYIAPICLNWFLLAKDPSLWTHIFASEYEDVTDELLVEVILAWCSNVKTLELRRRFDITLNQFREIFQKCPHIEELSLAFCTQVGDSILNLLPTHCKALSSINLEGCSQFIDNSVYNFVGLPLKRVCLSHCCQLSDEGAIFLARNFQNLIEVNFDGIQWITEEFVMVLVELQSQTLEKVYLDGENLTNDSVKKFSKCPNLKCLSFSFCTNMTQKALFWVGKCTKLNHLMLRKGANFTNEALLNYLKNMGEEQGKNFKFLNLAECTEISDECLFHLAEKCYNLETLDLSWCWEVSDVGLAFIIDNCHNLKELYLRGLHELYGVPFSNIISSLPRLTFLDLSQCNKVQDHLIEEVVQKSRELIVLNYYGDYVVNSLHRRAHLVT